MSVTITLYNIPSLLVFIASLVFDTSGNLYAANFGPTSYIVKIDTAGNATQLSTPQTGTNYSGMYYLNGYLYVCGYNYFIYQISVTTGVRTTIADFTSLGKNGTKWITYFAPYFYIVGRTGPGVPYLFRMEKDTWNITQLISSAIASTFGNPGGITVDQNGLLYIVDHTNDCVSVFDTSGSFIKKIITGVTFQVPLIYNNYLYLTNEITNYISKYDLSGNLITNTYAVGGLIYIGGGITFDNEGSCYTVNKITTNGVDNSLIMKTFTPPVLACFNEGSLILTDKGYIPVQDLRKGDLIKTEKNDFIPIDLIGFREIYHHATETRIKEQLYKCSKEEYPQLIEDLILTGCHSILIEDFSSKEEREYVKRMNGNIYRTGGKFRLPAYLDNRSSVYEVAGNYTIYHLALENDADYLNYGIYANGLLVETSSKRCLQDRFNMI